MRSDYRPENIPSIVMTVMREWDEPLRKTEIVLLAGTDYARTLGVIDALVFCGQVVTLKNDHETLYALAEIPF